MNPFIRSLPQDVRQTALRNWITTTLYRARLKAHQLRVDVGTIIRSWGIAPS